ncbi:MAG TPA: RNA polymerase subunit sigma-70 [Oscillatoriales cyanobacterium M59_W2019_021]|nr:MAG: RNA polymerase subunit sigma-70 [Cyanobacteria bacterium J055]HIK32079.1 RNA polymerase subunit sigma-70 [Oscillatoriales cyanobacterium M4454_W2019_049]HIK51281.1 RNA polymerase subunit sigma-70 [Oscillatoriales cyanobacterium M59_W2019_021]
MNQTQFDRLLQELTHRRREVLRQVLAGQSDGEIARSLHITEATVRKHVENICKHFGIRHDFPDDRRSKRPELIELFRQYQPELVSISESHKKIVSQETTATHTLYDRDVFVLIDRSGSMVRKDQDTRGLARYLFLQEEVESHVYAILSARSEPDNRSARKICDRLTVYFFCRDEVGSGPYTIDDASQIQPLFRQHPPKSHSFVVPTLQQCIETWSDRGKPQNRGAFVIIYTDGLFTDELAFVDCIGRICDRVRDHRELKILILGVGEELDKEHFLNLDFNINQQNPFNILVFDLIHEIDNILEVLERQLVDEPDLVFPAWVRSRYPEFIQRVIAARQAEECDPESA